MGILVGGWVEGFWYLHSGGFSGTQTGRINGARLGFVLEALGSGVGLRVIIGAV